MLNDRTIRDAKPKSSVYRLRDGKGGCRGFGVTVSPNGSKTFFLSYTSPEDGKRKQISLGRFPAMSLSAARRKALETRSLVDDGRDPAIEKKSATNQRIEKRALGTLGDLLELYIADLEADEKRSAKEVRRISKVDIPSHLQQRPAQLITKDDILDILTPIAEPTKKDKRPAPAPVHSDNVRAYLNAAFELGMNASSMTRWRGRAKNFEISINPVAATKKTLSSKPKGQRYLKAHQIGTLWHTTDLTPAMHLALKMILATGQRVEEVLHATWEEFDRDQLLWCIPGERRKTRGKTNEPHLVPLTDLHTGLLDEIRAATNHTTYLFPSQKGNGPRRYDSLTHAVRVFTNSTDFKHFSPRDLRRTFKTIAGSMRISLEMRNRLQGHALTDVGSVHYDRYEYLDEKQDAMKCWSKGLLEIIKGK